MVRGKTQMKFIENTISRQVTFSKRRNGLLKKASELSVLCDAEVALIIYSTRGKLYEFSSSNMSKIIERYEGRIRDTGTSKKASQDNMQPLKLDTISIGKKIETIEASKRKLMGNDLESSSFEELKQLEIQLERSLSKIRARKNQLLKEEIDRLKEEEKNLLEQNKQLREKCGMQPRKFSYRRREQSRSRESIDVETELFIGLPKRRDTGA